MTPNKVLLKFRLNPKRAMDMIERGVHEVLRDEARVVGRQIAQAKFAGKAMVRDRRDATGRERMDSGVKLFTSEKSKGSKLTTFSQLFEDLVRLKMVIDDVHLYKKDNDKMYSLVISFTSDDQAEDILDTLHQKGVIDLLGLAWENCHVWLNHDGLITINVAHIDTSKLEANSVDMISLRVNSEKEPEIFIVENE